MNLRQTYKPDIILDKAIRNGLKANSFVNANGGVFNHQS